MGADARIFLFDYTLYRDSIVPAFLRLMSSGAVEPWLQEFLQIPEVAERLGEDLSSSLPCLPSAFAEHCTYIDSELAVTRLSAVPTDEYDGNWEARACRDDVCKLRSSCPFHITHGDQLDLATDSRLYSLERLIAGRCLGQGQFLGRSVDCYFYWDTLDHLGVEPGHAIRYLLERLGRRGRFIGNRGSFGTEGIHGWLSPDETETLAKHLFTLKLPEYEYSFAAMNSFKHVRNILDGRVFGIEFQWPSYTHPTASFPELSLSYVRTVCALAARQGKGVLWGNDVA